MDLKTEVEGWKNKRRERGEDDSDTAVLAMLTRVYALMACEYLVEGGGEKANEYAKLAVEADKALTQIYKEAANG